MEYDIIIGEGEYIAGSFTTCDLCDMNQIRIGQNDDLYNVLNCIMDIKILIYKNTPEGERLKKYLIVGDSRKIKKLIQQIIFRKGSLYILNKKYHEKISNTFKSAYENGRKDKSAEIRNVIDNR